jgi:thiosulfate reductase cytochrome b subunit
MESQRKHSRLVIWTHWINVPILLLMMWSGVLIYWANQAYIKIPFSLATKLKINHRLAEAMGWHFFLMWIFFINGFIYVLYLLMSGEYKHILPHKKSFKEAFLVSLHRVRLIKHLPEQMGKYNAAQRVAYTFAIAMGFGSLVSGLAIYKPVQLGWLTFILGGYEAARLEHFVCMIGLMVFIVVHLSQVLISGWSHLRAMITGFDDEG